MTEYRSAGNTASPSGMESISRMAQSVFTRENLASAGRVATEQASELHHQAQDGDHSLRFMALIGGILLIVMAALQFLGKIVNLNMVGAVFELYTFLLGILVVLLEGKSVLLPKTFVERIHKYALFLKFLWGRGCLYFVCGTLQFYHIDLMNLISGGYMCFVGALMVLVGYRTANKLKNFRRSAFTEQELHEKFAQADLDGDGSLSVQQFRMLTQSLGLDMTRRETEAAFRHIKKTENEKLSYEEFQAWWTDADGDGDVDDNAFTFV